MKRVSVTDKKSSLPLSNVILEIGSSLIRGGIAGECVPRFIIPSPFFSPHSADWKALSPSNIKENCLEGIRLIFLEYLQIRSKDSNVLIIENLFAPKIFRDQLFNVLLNEMQVQSVCFQPDMLMPIVATGCQSGLVVDIGSHECRAVCIAHGRPILSSFVASSIGVTHASSSFHRSLNRLLIEKKADESDISGISGKRCDTMDTFITAELFERTAVACPLPVEQASDVFCSSADVVIPGWLRHDCLSRLIDGGGDDGGCEELGGVVGLLLACLLKSNADVQCIVGKNIVFTGGGSQIPGLVEAICHRMTSLLNDPNAAKSHKCFENIKKARPYFLSSSFNGTSGVVEIVSHDSLRNSFSQHPFPKSSLNWIGGSLFASVKANRATKFVHREEYLVKMRNLVTTSSTSVSVSSKASLLEAAHIHSRSGEENPLSAPDWLSTNPSDWRFLGPGNNVENVQSNRFVDKSSHLQKKSAGLGKASGSVRQPDTSHSETAATFFGSLLKK